MSPETVLLAFFGSRGINISTLSVLYLCKVNNYIANARKYRTHVYEHSLVSQVLKVVLVDLRLRSGRDKDLLWLHIEYVPTIYKNRQLLAHQFNFLFFRLYEQLGNTNTDHKNICAKDLTSVVGSNVKSAENSSNFLFICLIRYIALWTLPWNDEALVVFSQFDQSILSSLNRCLLFLGVDMVIDFKYLFTLSHHKTNEIIN